MGDRLGEAAGLLARACRRGGRRVAGGRNTARLGGRAVAGTLSTLGSPSQQFQPGIRADSFSCYAAWRVPPIVVGYLYTCFISQVPRLLAGGPVQLRRDILVLLRARGKKHRLLGKFLIPCQRVMSASIPAPALHVRINFGEGVQSAWPTREVIFQVEVALSRECSLSTRQPAWRSGCRPCLFKAVLTLSFWAHLASPPDARMVREYASLPRCIGDRRGPFGPHAYDETVPCIAAGTTVSHASDA